LRANAADVAGQVVATGGAQATRDATTSCPSKDNPSRRQNREDAGQEPEGTRHEVLDDGCGARPVEVAGTGKGEHISVVSRCGHHVAGEHKQAATRDTNEWAFDRGRFLLVEMVRPQREVN